MLMVFMGNSILYFQYRPQRHIKSPLLLTEEPFYSPICKSYDGSIKSMDLRLNWAWGYLD